MNEVIEQSTVTTELENSKPKQERLFAAGSIVAAVLASSCCIVPFILVMLGVGGAWVGNLTALEPYKPYFLGITALLLSTGFWHVYLKPKKPPSVLTMQQRLRRRLARLRPMPDIPQPRHPRIENV